MYLIMSFIDIPHIDNLFTFSCEHNIIYIILQSRQIIANRKPNNAIIYFNTATKEIKKISYFYSLFTHFAIHEDLLYSFNGKHIIIYRLYDDEEDDQLIPGIDEKTFGGKLEIVDRIILEPFGSYPCGIYIHNNKIYTCSYLYDHETEDEYKRDKNLYIKCYDIYLEKKHKEYKIPCKISLINCDSHRKDLIFLDNIKIDGIVTLYDRPCIIINNNFIDIETQQIIYNCHQKNTNMLWLFKNELTHIYFLVETYINNNWYVYNLLCTSIDNLKRNIIKCGNDIHVYKGISNERVIKHTKICGYQNNVYVLQFNEIQSINFGINVDIIIEQY
jgi:hypothetical protein